MKIFLDDDAIDKLLADDEESMTLVSLFTDKFKESSGRGFWADSLSLSNSGRIGSRIYESERENIRNQVLSNIKEAALDALRWMESDGIIRSLEVEVQRIESNRVSIKVNQKVIKIEL